MSRILSTLPAPPRRTCGWLCAGSLCVFCPAPSLCSVGLTKISFRVSYIVEALHCRALLQAIGMSETSAHPDVKLGWSKWLDQEVRGAELEAAASAFFIAKSRQNNHGKRPARFARSQAPHHFEAVHPRHIQVEQQKIRLVDFD